MKRNAIAIACAVVVAAAISIPLGTGNVPAPEAAIQPAAAAESSAESGSTRTEEAQDAVAEGANPRYEQGVVLVGLQDGSTADDLNARLADLDYIATKQVREDDLVFGYVELELADDTSVEDAENRIASENGDIIASAQPNYIYHALDEGASAASDAPTTQGTSSLVASVIAQATKPNDPSINSQWGLGAVKAYDAWDAQQTNGAVTVAVLDSGIDTDHEDFTGANGSLIVGACGVKGFSGTDAKTIVTGTSKAEDDNGHGTHVAGVVAAYAGNGKGIAGVSYNAKIMPVKVLDGNGDGNSFTLISGVEQVCSKQSEYNIRVLNLSLGEPSYDMDDADTAMINAIDKAHEAGILVVYASGNSGNELGAYMNTPSDYDTHAGAISVIGIARSGTSYKRSSFSNYNITGQTTKELSAPGSSVYSTLPNSLYGNSNGTSMAAPFVSGTAALMFAANPSLTPAQARNILCNTAQDIDSPGWDAQTGYGVIDTAAAVAAAKAGARTGEPLSRAEITLSQSSFIYSGAECRPHVTVELDGTKLAETQDFKVDYANNVNVGTATVVVTGINAYDGTLSKTFTIGAQNVTPTVTLGATSFTYDGKAKTPGVTVTVGSTPLPASSYSVAYAAGCVNVGSYTVTATLQGNYSGMATTSFTIVPKGTKISKLKAGKKSFAITWKKQTKQTTGYQVQCSLKKNFSSKNSTLTVSRSKTVSAKATKLKAKKRYYVRVRTFKKVAGTKYYSAWSAKKSVKTKA